METDQYSKLLKNYKKTDSISIRMLPLNKTKLKKKSDRWFFKRKRYVILFCVLCFFFLYYQIVSFIRLSWDVTDNAESAYLSKNNDKASKDELEFLKEQIAVYMPGVREERSKHYIKMSEQFKCLESGEMILFSQINDHFCDCIDGTDEPSTSACPNNIFYCVKHSISGKQFIHSSRVNDGVCDCCEGSDEWLNVTSHRDYSIEQVDLIRLKSNTFITPCKNQCKDF